MQRMTHGEAYVFKRENIELHKSLSQIEKSLSKLPPPMPREEALKYYTAKIRNYFRSKEAT